LVHQTGIELYTKDIKTSVMTMSVKTRLFFQKKCAEISRSDLYLHKPKIKQPIFDNFTKTALKNQD